jgi:hypothetical protein
MSTTIEINDNIEIVNITIVDEDNTVTLQPIVTRSGGGDLGLYMLKSVYDPYDRAEQVLTINSVIDGGTIT